MPARGIMEITSRYENGMFIFMIKDSGEGISPEDMERIFRPYYTTKEKGTGLGLSIVKRMINQHQGAIEVDSKKGEGTIFIIKINLRKKDIEDYDENFSN